MKAQRPVRLFRLRVVVLNYDGVGAFEELVQIFFPRAGTADIAGRNRAERAQALYVFLALDKRFLPSDAECVTIWLHGGGCTSESRRGRAGKRRRRWANKRLLHCKKQTGETQ